MNDDEYYSAPRRQTPIIQGDAELVHSFSEPDAQDFHEEFRYINKDFRMANTNTADEFYLNQSIPLSRAIINLIGYGSKSSEMLIHDSFSAQNMSVGRDGFGMKTLVTRRQEQRARLVQDSAGWFNKKNEDNNAGV